MYKVIVSIEKEGKVVYARLEYKGRAEWKTKRIAERHAREYKAKNMRDAWASKTD